MTTALDIMTTNPFTVRESTPLSTLAQKLIENKFSGAPVVDEDGKLIGVVTESDLIFQKKNLHLPTAFTLFDSVITFGSGHAMEKEMKKMMGATVGEIMTHDVVTVTEDTSLEEIATIIAEQGRHYLPVVKNEKVVGVIGRIDVLKAIVKES